MNIIAPKFMTSRDVGRSGGAIGILKTGFSQINTRNHKLSVVSVKGFDEPANNPFRKAPGSLAQKRLFAGSSILNSYKIAKMFQYCQEDNDLTVHGKSAGRFINFDIGTLNHDGPLNFSMARGE